ncbi:PREDICTED: uncharacterized protein LOC104593354 [Nelumbo nucifera]|uniref:Uncharacterized protein LOC104593354 n=1 Tax=Nelumbo nucifera TaxID=4432 RepID=A0A1U7ZCV1_NELNU|nr:PREDICTED: uncharacterized protein LOC104593354 [Nelumbo nucifera]
MARRETSPDLPVTLRVRLFFRGYRVASFVLALALSDGLLGAVAASIKLALAKLLEAVLFSSFVYVLGLLLVKGGYFWPRQTRVDQSFHGWTGRIPVPRISGPGHSEDIYSGFQARLDPNYGFRLVQCNFGPARIIPTCMYTHVCDMHTLRDRHPCMQTLTYFQ